MYKHIHIQINSPASPDEYVIKSTEIAKASPRPNKELKVLQQYTDH